MVSALVFAIVATAPAQTLGYKKLVFDDFTQGPYMLTLTGETSQSHAWHNLDRSHVAFGDRLTYLQINNNPQSAALTLVIGDGVERLSSPVQVAWHFFTQWGNDGTVELDLSNVGQFVADLSKVPDQTSVVMLDKNGSITSNGFWLLRNGGIYFRRTDFSGSFDWKHVRTVQFKQDFSSLPNPLVYTLTSFYATLKPVAIPPAPRVKHR